MPDNLTVPVLFDQAVSRFSRQTCLQMNKAGLWQRFSYAQVRDYSLKIAAFLISQGYQKGDAACLILENRPEWAMIYLGIVRAGMAAVPLDPQLNPAEIKALLRDSAARIIFTSPEIFARKIKGDIQDTGLKTVVLDSPQEGAVNFSDILRIESANVLFPEVRESDLASLIYTSGTTGEPKGVLLTQANICSNFQSIAQLKLCFPSDRIVSILPLHHTYAFMITFILPIFSGMSITYCPSFRPQELIRLVREAGITMLVGVPQFFNLLERALSEKISRIPGLFLPLAWVFLRLGRPWGRSLRLLVSGGARLEPKLHRRLSAFLGIKLIEGYGLTETSPVVTLNLPRRIKPGSVGKPIPGVEVKILDPDSSGVGQVLIKGANLMQGYFRHPDWTGQAIKEGWFYSGDLGYLDRDGYLYLAGREKEIIVLASGKNIYPEELEEYYAKSPYIKEICITSKEEEKFGAKAESLYAVIVPNLDYFRKTNESNIQAKLRWELENLGMALPSYQHIMGFMVIKEELPRTALKKIKRYRVREKYLSGSPLPDSEQPKPLPETLEGLDRELATRVIAYIAKEVKKPVHPESHLEIDLGIDSLTRVELGLGLEKLLGIKVPDQAVAAVSTVKELILKLTCLVKDKGRDSFGREGTQRSWAQLFSQAEEQEIGEKIRIDPVIADKLFTFLFKIIFGLILRLFWLLRVEGRNNLPASGPYILCSNHASYLDGFVIFCGIKFKTAMNTFFLGYSDILAGPLVRWAVKPARLVSIDPNTHLIQAMQAAYLLLKKGKIVCIFPEGRRSIDGNIGEFKKGIGILVKELGVPVVPVYIRGSHRAWPRTSRMPRFYPLKLTFGRPCRLDELLEKGRATGLRDDYQAISSALKDEVARLAC